ncbi:carbohydrate kinase family protein [Candidatus Chloroploca sp. Khr17]|uniref:carbohydrate kinase family protein n=1 Tax=Candidatus Chloroploca sp. Khr17 TaxID=2496869 RepID=UPI00101DA394|nr:carbohydrate kinase family protein [Candidatus Chloroploca sp. Khr17]
MIPETAGATVLVLGDINADLSFIVPSFPNEGGDISAQRLRWHSGGTGLNSAIAFSRLGAQVALLGRIGDDPAAEVVQATARKAGLDLRWVQTDSEVATGLCGVIVSPGGQRTFVSFRGANLRYHGEALPTHLLDTCDLLFLCAHALLEGSQQCAALQLAQLAFERALPVALDLCLPAIQQAREVVFAMLPQLWLLTMNEDELRALLPGMSLQQALDRLLQCGVAHVVIKRGAQGCSIADGRVRLDVLPPVVKVVDTNGCGDAFAAAYAWACLRGAEVRECATLANTMGALTATRSGAADAIPTRAELAMRLTYGLHYLLAPVASGS